MSPGQSKFNQIQLKCLRVLIVFFHSLIFNMLLVNPPTFLSPFFVLVFGMPKLAAQSNDLSGCHFFVEEALSKEVMTGFQTMTYGIQSVFWRAFLQPINLEICWRVVQQYPKIHRVCRPTFNSCFCFEISYWGAPSSILFSFGDDHEVKNAAIEWRNRPEILWTSTLSRVGNVSIQLQ